MTDWIKWCEKKAKKARGWELSGQKHKGPNKKKDQEEKSSDGEEEAAMNQGCGGSVCIYSYFNVIIINQQKQGSLTGVCYY